MAIAKKCNVEERGKAREREREGSETAEYGSKEGQADRDQLVSERKIKLSKTSRIN